MVELFEQDAREFNRQSSKGNQLKWNNHGYWYKADYTGYEGLAEYVISHLLTKSSLSSEEYVLYDLADIHYKRNVYLGACSQDFLQDDWQIITLERLFKLFFGNSLNSSIYQITDHEERLAFIVNQVERITGLTQFGVYMNKLFTIDAFFLNEDRHTHNIAVLMNSTNQFSLCPIFDNGAGLLSDTTMDYPMNQNVYELLNDVQPKTICNDFDEQLDISEHLFGTNLKLHFSDKDVIELLDHAEIYSEQERERVLQILRVQMRKYQYLFVP